MPERYEFSPALALVFTADEVAAVAAEYRRLLGEGDEDDQAAPRADDPNTDQVDGADGASGASSVDGAADDETSERENES